MNTKFRLYIDEVGHSDLGKSLKPENKYLSLTGVAIDLKYVDDFLHPQMEDLKRKYFEYHADEPIILHRKEILNKKPPFQNLRSVSIEDSFNSELISLLDNWEYTVFTILIDKSEQKDRYKIWQFEPYHYCLRILLERFVLWLEEKDSCGDVLAESRGGKADLRLKDSFNRLFHSGTEYITTERFQARLTSCQLKVKPKANNIAGLQLADLLAYPSHRYVLAYYAKKALEDNFSRKIVEILIREKYNRRKDGRIEGYGIKLLP